MDIIKFCGIFGSILCLVFAFASASLTINEIIGPESVQIDSKEDLILECDYEMEDEEDAVLKWFFNGLEDQIYQWIVGDDQAYALGSLKDLIDTNYSVNVNNVKTFRALKFKEISPALTGNYTCKLDGTSSDDKWLPKQVIVFSPPSSFEMFIVGGNDEFPGDEFVLCDATNVSPKPNFDLYISEEDGMVVPNGTIIKKDTMDKEGNYNLSITLHFNASYLDAGTTKFVCRLSIPGTNYTESRTMEYLVETEIEPSPFDNISEDYSSFNYTSNSTEEYLSEDEVNGTSQLCSLSLLMLLLTLSLVLAT